MDSLGTTLSAPMLGLVALALLALTIARAISPVERRLVTAAAMIGAGVFLTATPGTDGALAAVGFAGWAVGLAAFVRAGVAWRREAASRAGPWAAVLLLPPAFLGALVLLGLAAALLPDPLRGALGVMAG